MPNSHNRLFAIFLVLFTFSCSKKTIESTREIIIESAKDEIIFLSGYITSHDNHFVLSNLEVNKADGKLKKNEKPYTIKTGDLEITQYDSNKKIIAKNYIPNPLVMDLEYVNEDDQFARKTEELKEGSFDLRFQKQLGACSLSITRIDLKKSTHSNTLKHELCRQ
jgi:hypothetical protein